MFTCEELREVNNFFHIKFILLTFKLIFSNLILTAFFLISPFFHKIKNQKNIRKFSQNLILGQQNSGEVFNWKYTKKSENPLKIWSWDNKVLKKFSTENIQKKKKNQLWISENIKLGSFGEIFFEKYYSRKINKNLIKFFYLWKLVMRDWCMTSTKKVRMAKQAFLSPVTALYRGWANEME